MPLLGLCLNTKSPCGDALWESWRTFRTWSPAGGNGSVRASLEALQLNSWQFLLLGCRLSSPLQPCFPTILYWLYHLWYKLKQALSMSVASYPYLLMRQGWGTHLKSQHLEAGGKRISNFCWTTEWELSSNVNQSIEIRRALTKKGAWTDDWRSRKLSLQEEPGLSIPRALYFFY